jgi:hypothetical protein
MFRHFDSSSSLSNKQQWRMSPSRCAWMYLDHMLSHIRKAITDAGSAPEATPGRRIPYSREEVSETLVRMVMKRGGSSESTHAFPDRLSIVWGSAMGHQYDGPLKAMEVRINLHRPTGGTHDAAVPRPMRGSPASPILLEYKDNFHALLLVAGRGNMRTYIMTILILRLATLVATRDYLLNGVEIIKSELYKTIASSQIAESYYLQALYDSEDICVEAIKGCLRNNCFWMVLEAENMPRCLSSKVPAAKQALWNLITPHCNMDVIEEAANLVYHSPRGTSREAIAAKATELTSDYGIFNFFGQGENAERLNNAVLDTEGTPRQGNKYMRDALELVAANGVVTQPFGQALCSERTQFCKNRIKHIGASEDELIANNGAITTANVILARETFGSPSYKAGHDIKRRKR